MMINGNKDVRYKITRLLKSARRCVVKLKTSIGILYDRMKHYYCNRINIKITYYLWFWFEVRKC